MNRKSYFFGLAAMALLCSMLISCGMSTDDIARRTEKLIIEKYADGGIAVKIKEPLVLIKRSNTDYKGMATVSVAGDEVELSVDVVCDGDNIQAEWRQGG